MGSERAHVRAVPGTEYGPRSIMVHRGKRHVRLEYPAGSSPKIHEVIADALRGLGFGVERSATLLIAPNGNRIVRDVPLSNFRGHEHFWLTVHRRAAPHTPETP